MKVKLNYGKKFLSLVMALTIITALFPITANAYTGTQYGDLYYEINYDNTITITDCNENAVSVDIPAKINGKSVTSIDRGAFLNCKSLTSITIPNSVTSIGSIAFEDCRSLTSITIPNSVTNIGNKAFSWCSSLTDVNIPSSVASIGNEAFSDCTSLTSITVDSSNSNYSSVNGNLFNKEKTELIQYAIGKTDTHYIIPYSATSIGSSAFSHCSSLTDVNIPNSVISIGYEAFYGCTSLTSVEIPDGVTSVDKWAFSNCISLTSVTIPDSVTSIGNEAFSGCSNLANINVDSGNPNYSSVNGNLFNKDKTELIQYAVGKTDTHYTIPDSVTSIGDEAFYMCRKLTSVTIPDSVTSIGNEAFFACYSLTSINVDSENPNYSSVNGNLFNKDKTELIQYTVGKTDTHYTIPDSVTSIGNYAFFDCSLTSITISGNVTNIGDNAFSWSGSLTIITIPKSVTRIGFYAFYGCETVYTGYVYYGGRESDWQKIFIDSI